MNSSDFLAAFAAGEFVSKSYDFFSAITGDVGFGGGIGGIGGSAVMSHRAPRAVAGGDDQAGRREHGRGVQRRGAVAAVR